MYALMEKRQRLHDTIIFKNDRLLIDIQRFVLYFFDRPNEQDYDYEKEDQRVGHFLSSILFINKFISGKYDFSNCCLVLKDFNKQRTIGI